MNVSCHSCVLSFIMVLILSLELITETLMQRSSSENPLLCPVVNSMMKKLHFPPYYWRGFAGFISESVLPPSAGSNDGTLQLL